MITSIRILLGTLLLIAGIGKLLNISSFISAVSGYKLLPRMAVIYFSRILPYVEIFVGISLWVRVFDPWNEILASCLFVMFAVAITINLLRGRRNISCGCLGPNNKNHLNWQLVFRNILFVSLAVYCSTVHWFLCTSITVLFSLMLFITLYVTKVYRYSLKAS